jgi:NADH-quinone oxidoreductase subunit H
MLLVTIFLGGWQLPFFHRDGLTIAFGDTTYFRMWIPHIWMVIIGVLAFFGKTLAICFVQAFVRWSLPRFRYDQLMKLGWTVLLPASLANLFATGIVYLAIDQAGDAIRGGLKIAGDISQALVALALTALLVRAIVGFLTPRKQKPFVVGSSAKLAAAAGGAQSGPMQA